jgi:hypothetical protein
MHPADLGTQEPERGRARSAQRLMSDSRWRPSGPVVKNAKSADSAVVTGGTGTNPPSRMANGREQLEIEICKARKQGATLRAIAEAAGLTHETVRRIAG